MKKSLLITTIVLMFLVATTMTCNATELGENTVSTNEDAQDLLIGSDLGLRDEAVRGNAVVLGENGTYWTFSKSSEKTYFNTAKSKKVSADYRPGATCTVSTSRTFSASFSVSINSSQKSLIKNSASANVVNSISSSTSYSLPNTSSSKYAHVLFTPRYDKIVGKLKKRNTMDGSVISEKAVTAKYPVKLSTNGELDGTYDLEYHSKNKCNR